MAFDGLIGLGDSFYLFGRGWLVFDLVVVRNHERDGVLLHPSKKFKEPLQREKTKGKLMDIQKTPKTNGVFEIL